MSRTPTPSGSRVGPRALCFAPLLLACSPSLIAQVPSDALADRIRTVVEKRMAEHRIPSVALGVILHGKLAFTSGYGRVRAGSAGKPDALSLFQIASQSKMLTGIIANRLIAEGELEADAPIVKYLGDVLSAPAKRRLADVRLKHLLTHTSGIPNRHCLIFTYAPRPRVAGYSETQLLRDLNSVRLERRPGTAFDYSNSGYVVLGYVCEKASGKTYAQLLREYVTEPYKMRNTGVALRAEQEAMAVAPAYPDPVAGAPWIRDWGKAVPPSGVISNVIDLCALQAEQLRAYRSAASSRARNPLVLTEASVSALPKTRYGYGIFEWPQPGGHDFSHSGNVDTFLSDSMFCPEKNVGLVFLTTSAAMRATAELQKEVFCLVTGRAYTPAKVKKSLAQFVSAELRTSRGKAAIENIASMKKSGDYYCEPQEFLTLICRLVGQGKLGEAKDVYSASRVAFDETLPPLAVEVLLKTAESGIEAGLRHFERYRDASDYVVREHDFNSAGYALMAAKRLEDAYRVFECNAWCFPEAPNVYDSLGDASFQLGRIAAALAFYEKAMQLDPRNPAAQLSIERIQKTQRAGAAQASAAKKAVSPRDAEELAGIRATLMDYIDGTSKGQPDRLRRAFHPDLNLYSVDKGKLKVWVGRDYISNFKPGVANDRRGRILSIDYENDAATAKVEITRPSWPRPYIDYFLLLKLENRWTIIHKMYTKKSK